VKLTDFLFCEFAFLDRFGRLCAIGITPEIVAPRLPIGIAKAMIVARTVAEKSDTARMAKVGLKISVNGRWGQPESTDGIQIIQQPGFMFIVFRLFMVEHAGRYEFAVLLDGKFAGSMKLDVRIDSGDGP
jgi:hypothetical protein